MTKLVALTVVTFAFATFDRLRLESRTTVLATSSPFLMLNVLLYVGIQFTIPEKSTLDCKVLHYYGGATPYLTARIVFVAFSALNSNLALPSLISAENDPNDAPV